MQHTFIQRQMQRYLENAHTIEIRIERQVGQNYEMA